MVMNQSRCCEIGVSNSRLEMPVAQSRGERPRTRRPSMARRYLNTAGWLVPGAILALMPKCPMCLAAYVAVWTGVGLSLPAAANLRLLLLVLCVGALLYLAARYLCQRQSSRKRDSIKTSAAGERYFFLRWTRKNVRYIPRPANGSMRRNPADSSR
jgi:Flp pilus assembly protein TadB